MRTRAVNCSHDFKEKRNHLIFCTSSPTTSLLLMAPTGPKYCSNCLQPRGESLFLKNPAASAYGGCDRVLQDTEHIPNNTLFLGQ